MCVCLHRREWATILPYNDRVLPTVKGKILPPFQEVDCIMTERKKKNIHVILSQVRKGPSITYNLEQTIVPLKDATFFHP